MLQDIIDLLETIISATDVSWMGDEKEYAWKGEQLEKIVAMRKRMEDLPKEPKP